MKKATELDLVDLSDILEGFVNKLDKMAEKDVIDLAARLKPVVKHCEKIDTFVKDKVKAKLKHDEGTVLGGLFKAVLKLVPCTRLDQKALKEAHPKIHAEFCVPGEDERVTFELR